jgi:hypothetical protein
MPEADFMSRLKILQQQPNLGGINADSSNSNSIPSWVLSQPVYISVPIIEMQNIPSGEK